MLQGTVPLLPGLLTTGLTNSLLQGCRVSVSFRTNPFSPVDIFLASLLLCPEASCHRLHAREKTVDPRALETPVPPSTPCGSVKLPAAQDEWISWLSQTIMSPSVLGKLQAGNLSLFSAGYKLLTGQREPRSLQHYQNPRWLDIIMIQKKYYLKNGKTERNM